MPICISCRKTLLDKIGTSDSGRCRKCGKKLLSEKDICTSCRKSAVLNHCDSVLPLFSYRLWKKNLLYEWKMNDRRVLTDLFSSFLYKAILLRYPDKKIPYLVPVPPRKGKIKERGWDQIDELCCELKKKPGIKIYDALERYSSEQQKKNCREKRLGNNHRFGLRHDFVKWIKCHPIPKEVVLIDDVITTGATIEECSVVLKDFGVSKVNVMSIFIVD